MHLRQESGYRPVKKLISVIAALAVLLSAAIAAPCAFAEGGNGSAVVYKDPTGEEVTEGEDALFVARAYNYEGIVWMFVSSDGATVYENTEALTAFPGLDMGGYEGEELRLVSIPYSMNGWYVQAKFIDSDGDYVLSDKALITVNRGDVPSPGVTMQSSGARLTVGEKKTLSVSAVSPDGDLIKYQWYRSYSAVRSSAEPIVGATSAEYTPPEEVGQVFYYVVVWCVSGRETSAPVYTAPVAIVYSEAPATPEPTAAPDPVPSPIPSAEPQSGRGSVFGGRALGFTVGAILLITLLAVAVTVILLRSIAKRQEAEELGDDEEE